MGCSFSRQLNTSSSYSSSGSFMCTSSLMVEKEKNVVSGQRKRVMHLPLPKWLMHPTTTYFPLPRIRMKISHIPQNYATSTMILYWMIHATAHSCLWDNTGLQQENVLSTTMNHSIQTDVRGLFCYGWLSQRLSWPPLVTVFLFKKGVYRPMPW